MIACVAAVVAFLPSRVGYLNTERIRAAPVPSRSVFSADVGACSRRGISGSGVG